MPKKARTLRSETPERREELVAWLRSEGVLTYEQIQKRFSIAPMTSRRDVAALHEQGKLVRVLRGAMRVHSGGLLTEGPLYLRQRKNLAAKQQVAQAALKLIEPGRTLFLDAGTTCIELARAIAQQRLAVTIVTNSVLISACFCEGAPAKVIQIGGQLNSFSGCVTGPESEAAAAGYFIDIGFFTTLGYVPGEGTYESLPETFRVKQAFAERCADLILLMDHTKFGQRALNRVFPDDRIKRIVTDRPIGGKADPRFLSAS
ncbi:MAG: DeoR/GlpR transcriptional regulator [Opitutaceae bacterium]|nr:DeoR/GlpR transcriptional regulator [Cephaloticoccus sp.]MCP5529324.1 DeoR/GlpR transcriptional regulator [Opitutaceae bacterium]